MPSGEQNSSRHRRLVRGDLELWAQVTRHVTPMPGKARPLVPADAHKPQSRPTAAPHPTLEAASKAIKKIKPLAPLEASTLRKLARGRTEPEAKLDLHGMRQAEAHHQLRGFLHNAVLRGFRLVIVVTGKGGSGSAFHPDERGVLRRNVPHWLTAADLRPIVLGFTQASPRHGGDGAMYVRLRASHSKRLHPGI